MKKVKVQDSLTTIKSINAKPDTESKSGDRKFNILILAVLLCAFSPLATDMYLPAIRYLRAVQCIDRRSRSSFNHIFFKPEVTFKGEHQWGDVKKINFIRFYSGLRFF